MLAIVPMTAELSKLIDGIAVITILYLEVDIRALVAVRRPTMLQTRE